MRSMLLSSALMLSLAGPVLAQPTTAPPAAQYVKMAGQSDRFEIESGKIAARKGSRPGVKTFGARMIGDHTKSTDMVVAAAEKSGLKIGPPPPFTTEQQAMLDALRSQSGTAFDKTYVTQQTTAHKEALALQNAYATAGADPNLKLAAGKIVPVVKMHLTMLQELRAKGM